MSKNVLPKNLVQDPSQELTIFRAERDALRNSREFRLGFRFRQNRFFRWVRHLRWKNRLVEIQLLDRSNAHAQAGKACLLGAWYDEYPLGFPLDLVERSWNAWRVIQSGLEPDHLCLVADQPAELVFYTQDENFRLDFRADETSGFISVRTARARRTLDLYNPQPEIISVFPNRGEVEIFRQGEKVEGDSSENDGFAAYPQQKGIKFSEPDMFWAEQQSQHPQPLSVNHPDWRGILASSRQMFDQVFLIPDNLDRNRGMYFARLFLEAGVPSITIQGFPLSYVHLVNALRKLAPRLPIFVIYHGNYLHVREDYDWNSFKTIKALHDAGDITRVGFVKKGMAEVMSATGMRASFVMNLVRRLPDGPSNPLPGGPHVGIWGQPDWSWKKPPYAMIASLALVPGAQAHVYHVSPRAKEYGDFLGISAQYIYPGVPQDEVSDTMAQMHVNLYVSLTECAPMMPLESLSHGAPCLFGPNTPYFQSATLDHPYLSERLVVPYPEQAEVIAQYTRRVLEERDRIISAYCEYAPGYNARALTLLRNFLEYPIKTQ